MDFPVTISEGRCDLRAFTAHLHGLHGAYVISVRRDTKTRTNPQNKYLWGCVYPLILDGLIDIGWELTDKEDVHEFCAKFRDRQVVNRNTGELVHLPRSTSKMNTVEMTAYCDTLRDFAREYLNTEIPDPDPEYYGKA